MAKKINWKKPLLIISVCLLLVSLFSIYQNFKFLKSLNNNFSPQKLLNDSKKIQKKLKTIDFFLTKKIKKQLFAKYLPNNTINEDNYLDFLADVQIVLTHLLDGEKNYLIFLQNSDELRATGGFMGSYLLLEIKSGQIAPLKIKDIYELSGQFAGYRVAPPGLEEYLSGGEGMQLQDSNWNPDLPSTAVTIINFYDNIAQNSPYVKKQNIDGLMMFNLDLMKNLLAFLGPVNLNDYRVTVDQNNLADLARQSRSEFFPGSNEKANFLNALFKQIIIKLENLNNQEKIALINFLIQEGEQKNIQFFSQNDELEQIFKKYQVAGELNYTPASNFYLSSIESNVGINKANAKIGRQIKLITDGERISAIEIQFTNHNHPPEKENSNQYLEAANHLSYINYQRFYLSPETKIKKVSEIDDAGQNIQELDFRQSAFFNSSHQEFNEIAFLIDVSEQETKTIRLNLAQEQSLYPLHIQKQAGINKLHLVIENRTLQNKTVQDIQSGNFQLNPLK